MSKIYDDWEKLVAAVNKREQYRQLCYSESLRSSFGSASFDSDASTSSRRYSFDLSSSDQYVVQQAAHDGNSEAFATTSSANSRFDHVPKPPKLPSRSRFDRIFGAARRFVTFVTPVRKRPESQPINLPQLNETDILSGYAAPTELEVKREEPTIDAYALSFEELTEQTSNFGLEALIAEVYYGEVYFARLKSGKDVVLKMLHASFEYDSNDEFIRKVSYVSNFKHENLVEFLGYSIEGGFRVLAYEFATVGTLHDFLHGRIGVTGAPTGPVLDWMQRVRIAVDTARGLEYLHQNAFVYRDIRSSNVLLFDDFKAKIADIKVSNISPDGNFNSDPLYYLIPPQRYGYQYHATEESVDITLPRGQQTLVDWAKPKLSGNKVESCVDPKLMGEYPPEAAAKLAAVAELCVQYEPEQRPDMRIVVEALQPLLKAPDVRI